MSPPSVRYSLLERSICSLSFRFLFRISAIAGLVCKAGSVEPESTDTQECYCILLISRKPFVASRAHLNDGKIRRIRFSQKAFCRNVVTIARQLSNPSRTVDAPRLLSFINKFNDLINFECITRSLCSDNGSLAISTIYSTTTARK